MNDTNFYVSILDKNPNNKSEKILNIKRNCNLTLNEPFTYPEDSIRHNFDLILENNSDTIPSITNRNLKLINQNQKTTTNLFLTIGPRQSGKSTFLRGSKIVNQNLEGFMLKLIKEAYNLSLKLITNADDIILIKLAIVIFQKEKIFNLIDTKNTKNYFDEFFINEKTNTVINLKHFLNFKEISDQIEKSLNKREDIIDLNWDHIISYQFVIEIKNNKLQTNLAQQFDFMEFNFNGTTTTQIQTFIDNLLLKTFSSENRFLLERYFYRNSDNFNMINLYLCLENIILNSKKFKSETYFNKFNDICIEIKEYLKIVNYFKILLARNDIAVKKDESCSKCINISNIKKVANEELTNEVIRITEELEEIKTNLSKVKLTKKKLNKTDPLDNKTDLKIQRLYDKISMDSIKLEKLVNQVDSIFKRTQNNISSIKNISNNLNK